MVAVSLKKKKSGGYNHGEETLTKAFENSCNPIFAQLALRIGVSKYYSYVRMLGFYDITGIDLPATLLGMLGIGHQEFTYSKDLLDASAPHFAFFTFPDAMGMVTDSSSVVYDNTSGLLYSSEGSDADSLLKKSKAYLQKLYDDLEQR